MSFSDYISKHRTVITSPGEDAIQGAINDLVGRPRNLSPEELRRALSFPTQPCGVTIKSSAVAPENKAITMHIAIDDTYGPAGPTRSKYLTGARRTHVAVVFSDDEVEEVRKQIRSCLDFIGELLPRPPKEFHFVDIYNGNGHWAPLKDGRNIHLIEAFCSIYSNYRWPVMLQTIDDRTFRDHGIKEFRGIIDDLNLSDRNDMSLLMLCIKIKKTMNDSASPLTLIVDEGKKKSNRKFGQTLFRDWKGQYRGYYASSSEEPLLQIADLLAFCTNRVTHLSTKEKRTETDEEFIRIVSSMRIRSEDISPMVLPRDFTVEDIDRFHAMDRLSKGLKD